VIAIGAGVALAVALAGAAIAGWSAPPHAPMVERGGPRNPRDAQMRQLDVAVHRADALRRAVLLRAVLIAAQRRLASGQILTAQGGHQSGGEPVREPPRAQPTDRACGGDLPPCDVLWRESRGQADAVNRSCGCAFGLWQFQQPTWDSTARAIGRLDLVGRRASDVDPGTQDAMAAALWAGGAGCGNWSAC
jgi:hypothetical protein